jgi:hypothetical protein
MLVNYSLCFARQAQYASRLTLQVPLRCSLLPAASQLGTSDDNVHNLPSLSVLPSFLVIDSAVSSTNHETEPGRPRS